MEGGLEFRVFDPEAMVTTVVVRAMEQPGFSLAAAVISLPARVLAEVQDAEWSLPERWFRC